MRADIFPSVFQGQVNSPSSKASIKVYDGTESRDKATVANETRDIIVGPPCVKPVLWTEGQRVWEQQPAPDLQKP